MRFSCNVASDDEQRRLIATIPFGLFMLTSMAILVISAVSRNWDYDERRAAVTRLSTSDWLSHRRDSVTSCIAPAVRACDLSTAFALTSSFYAN